MDLRDLLICGIRRGELARVAGNVPGPEANVGTVSRTLIEKGDFTSSGLPGRHNTKSDCARRDAEGIRN